uniref:uncharacterized protein C18orf19 homolog A-like n=1 Tax=Styela clava TaxID=7725 RepID=UPI00193ACF99|nr:uncharacterized protein C18orf19 homolog A-like [Styela clava]
MALRIGVHTLPCIKRLSIKVSNAAKELKIHHGYFHQPCVSNYCGITQLRPEVCRTLFNKNINVLQCRYYRSATHQRAKSKSKKDVTPDAKDNIDDLKALLQDKSMGFTAKFKVLFRQYGVVLIVVHSITAVFWMGLFYFAVSRGFDIVPFLEKYGVFDFLNKIGLPASDKLKSPGASNLLAAYLLYEVAKPVRYPVTIISTIYAVRILRRLGHFKRPPKTDATMRELVQTQGKIIQHQLRHHTSRLQRNRRKSKTLGQHKKNGKKTNGGNGSTSHV